MRSMFLAHGSPMNALADNEYTRFLNQLGKKLSPEAILIISAHWESDFLTLTRTDGIYETIYDFYGFPKELYDVQYPARGSATVADMVADQLASSDFLCSIDETRGMDHGSWTLLKHLFPNADVPVVQMSLNANLEAEEQICLGQALQGLKDSNLLVIGSGVTVHNLRLLDWNKDFDALPEPWAVEFDDWLLANSSLHRLKQLEAYLQLAPNARKAAPTLEHFVPYLIARGAGFSPEPKVLQRSYEMGSLSYMSVEF